MKAIVFDDELRVVDNRPLPEIKSGWALIRIKMAGICRTDLEITKGYMNFQGILGHEFVGEVAACDIASWMGRRVVGEINAGCGRCPWCKQGIERHCPQRTTLGILKHDGCMAEYCVLPCANLYTVDQNIPDERAVMTELLAAACEILEQLSVDGTERVIVLGDGSLGILCAWVLATVTPHVTLVGHHRHKLEIARWGGIHTSLRAKGIDPDADIVVEATGTGGGIAQAMSLCRPRGTIVLKSTVAVQEDVNLAPVVINELNIIGSRCGVFRDALDIMRRFPDMPLQRLITDRYPLYKAGEAFDRARNRKTLKVILDI
ncbi:MAG: MDR/zinc-dependent alcohol dehydrogenase-like family protein [Thermodesulfobacteriota bacterium]